MKRIVALIFSILIMAIIFYRIDFGRLRDLLGQTDPVLFTVGVLFFIPQVLVTAYRWQVMVRGKIRLGLWESCRLILTCNALNILIPSRVGDLSKAYFLKKEGKLEINRGMNIVLFEKYVDLASLGLVILVGILFDFRADEATLAGLFFSLSVLSVLVLLYFFRVESLLVGGFWERHKILSKLKRFLLDTQAYLMELKAMPKKLAWILFLSVFLWFLHLFQFYFIFLALHSSATMFQVFRLVPLAILIGLVPLTIAGVGTRDSALLYFFAPYDEAARIVGVGLFASLRYFVPGILGLPFLNQYIVAPSAKEPSHE